VSNESLVETFYSLAYCKINLVDGILLPGNGKNSWSSLFHTDAPRSWMMIWVLTIQICI